MQPFRDHRPTIQANRRCCPQGRCATCRDLPAQLRYQFLETMRRAWSPAEIASLCSLACLAPETCDRCGPAVIAAYRADRMGELCLCGHCASQHWQALSAQGWTFWPLCLDALAPQFSATADNDHLAEDTPGGPSVR